MSSWPEPFVCPYCRAWQIECRADDVAAYVEAGGSLGELLVELQAIGAQHVLGRGGDPCRVIKATAAAMLDGLPMFPPVTP